MPRLSFVDSNEITQELRLAILEFFDGSSKKLGDFFAIEEIAGLAQNTETRHAIKQLNASLLNAGLIKKTNFMGTRGVTYETTEDGKMILRRYREIEQVAS